MLLFAATTIIVLKFLGELFLLFLISALISNVLKIDKASKELKQEYLKGKLFSKPISYSRFSIEEFRFCRIIFNFFA